MELKSLKTCFISFIQTLFAYLVVDRCFDLNILLLNLETLSVTLSAAIPCDCDDSEFIKRAIVRYIFVSYILAIRKINLRVHEKFPTLHSLVDAGLLSENEAKTLTFLKTTIKMNNSRILLAWAMNVMAVFWKRSLGGVDVPMRILLVELTQHHRKLQHLYFDNLVSINFVYSLIAKLCVLSSIVLVAIIVKLFSIINNWVSFLHSYWAGIFVILFIYWILLSVIYFALLRSKNDLELNYIINRYVSHMKINVDDKPPTDESFKHESKNKLFVYNLFYYTLEHVELIDTIPEYFLQSNDAVFKKVNQFQEIDVKDKTHMCAARSCSLLQNHSVTEFESGFLSHTDLGDSTGCYKEIKPQYGSSNDTLQSNDLNLDSRGDGILETNKLKMTNPYRGQVLNTVSAKVPIHTNKSLRDNASKIIDNISSFQSGTSLDENVSNLIFVPMSISPNTPLDDHVSNIIDSISSLQASTSSDAKTSKIMDDIPSLQTDTLLHAKTSNIIDAISSLQASTSSDAKASKIMDDVPSLQTDTLLHAKTSNAIDPISSLETNTPFEAKASKNKDEVSPLQTNLPLGTKVSYIIDEISPLQTNTPLDYHVSKIIYPISPLQASTPSDAKSSKIMNEASSLQTDTSPGVKVSNIIDPIPSLETNTPFEAKVSKNKDEVSPLQTNLPLGTKVSYIIDEISPLQTNTPLDYHVSKIIYPISPLQASIPSDAKTSKTMNEISSLHTDTSLDAKVSNIIDPISSLETNTPFEAKASKNKDEVLPLQTNERLGTKSSNIIDQISSLKTNASLGYHITTIIYPISLLQASTPTTVAKASKIMDDVPSLQTDISLDAKVRNIIDPISSLQTNTPFEEKANKNKHEVLPFQTNEPFDNKASKIIDDISSLQKNAPFDAHNRNTIYPILSLKSSSLLADQSNNIIKGSSYLEQSQSMTLDDQASSTIDLTLSTPITLGKTSYCQKGTPLDDHENINADAVTPQNETTSLNQDNTNKKLITMSFGSPETISEDLKKSDSFEAISDTKLTKNIHKVSSFGRGCRVKPKNHVTNRNENNPISIEKVDHFVHDLEANDSGMSTSNSLSLSSEIQYDVVVPTPPIRNSSRRGLCYDNWNELYHYTLPPPPRTTKKIFSLLRSYVRCGKVSKTNTSRSDLNDIKWNRCLLPLPPLPPRHTKRSSPLVGREDIKDDSERNNSFSDIDFYEDCYSLECQNHIYEEIDVNPNDIEEALEKKDEKSEEIDVNSNDIEEALEKKDEKSEELDVKTKDIQQVLEKNDGQSVKLNPEYNCFCKASKCIKEFEFYI